MLAKPEIHRNQRTFFRVAYGYDRTIGSAAEVLIEYGQRIIACMIEQIRDLDGQVFVDFELHVEILSGRHVHKPLTSEFSRISYRCLHGLTAETWITHRISSKLVPAAKLSSTTETGIRVPFIHALPLQTAGSVVM